MQVFSFGPFVLGGDRLAFVIGVWVFMGITAILSVRLDRRFGNWATLVLVAGLVAARLGHVVDHAESFAQEPLRALAFWQGGFSAGWGAVAVVLASSLHLRMRHFLVGAGVALGLSLAAWNLVWQLGASTEPVPLPDVTFEHLDGRPVTLAEHTGRPAVVNLWATWCPPCRREMPMMAELAAASDDATFVFVNQGEGRAAVERYLAQAGLALDHLLLDPHGQAGRHYAMPGLPVTLFIDAQGRMRGAHMGEISRELLLDGIAALADE
ncbi:TlpA disulfide reductase family protein [Geminicoccaceae bacterium 1502E]|nr:TlpA disulfide reductase family protein [Geminicoccaceae bacterium 1502E]